MSPGRIAGHGAGGQPNLSMPASIRSDHARDDDWDLPLIGDRWNVTAAETERTYPCDSLVPDPSLQLWRAVTVDALPQHLWPWICQIRIAPYSYDWIDNLGRRSPQTLQGLPDPVVGEPFTKALGGRPYGRILAVESGVHLTATIVGTVMCYVLVPSDDGRRTRLLLKIVARNTRRIAPLLALGDLIMARRQLLNLAALAEGTQTA